MYEKVESFVAGCRPPRLIAVSKFAIVLVALAALCSCAVAEEDSTGNAANMWIEKGTGLFMNGSYEEALEAYDEAIEIDPENGSLWKGKILIELGRFEDALECFNRSIGANPESAEAWYLKGSLLGEMGWLEEALFALNKTIELDPEDPNAWLDKGGVLRTLGREDEAEMAITTAVDVYENTILQNPNDADTWYRKGLALYTLGEYEEAVLSFDEAIEIGADFGRLWYYKGLASQALGQEAEADAAFAKARVLGYGTSPALSLAITNVISVGEDEFIEMENDGNETQTFMGLTLTIDEKETVVLPDFTLEPGERIRFHFGVGESNETDVYLDGDLALDDVAGNLTLKDSAGTLDKFAAYWTPEETSERWIEKGRELQRNESYEDALDALNNATDIDPQNATAWLIKANILGPNLVRYNESLEACDKALQINPDDADAWRLRGLILMNLGRPEEESLAAFDEATELDPQDGFAWYLKGSSLQRLGRETEAEAALARAEELGFTSLLAGTLAITNITATGEDEFIEIFNNLEDAKNLDGWTLVIDENETIRLPNFTLEPGTLVRVHLGEGDDTETDLFMNSEIALNDTAPSASLRDESGNEICFLGFEEKPDGGVVVSKHCVSEV